MYLNLYKCAENQIFISISIPWCKPTISTFLQKIGIKIDCIFTVNRSLSYPEIA